MSDKRTRKDVMAQQYPEAIRLLRLIDMEFRTDPMSVQCFDLRMVQDVRDFVLMDDDVQKIPERVTA